MPSGTQEDVLNGNMRADFDEEFARRVMDFAVGRKRMKWSVTMGGFHSHGGTQKWMVCELKSY